MHFTSAPEPEDEAEDRRGASYRPGRRRRCRIGRKERPPRRCRLRFEHQRRWFEPPLAESEYNKNWSTTFYETTSCHVARIDDFTEAGEAIPGGVEFEQRILSLHVATWHIFERGRDRCETKWTEVRDAVAAFVD